jgi:hypothetical protein
MKGEIVKKLESLIPLLKKSSITKFLSSHIFLVNPERFYQHNRMLSGQ